MSATGRSDVRRADDFYATPSWTTRAILPHLTPFKSALDPCAGEGAILREVLSTSRDRTWGIELDVTRAGACRKICSCWSRDALTKDSAPYWKLDTRKPVDLIITNPPFCLAQEFIETSLRTGAKEIAFLLRLNFLESQKRAAFWKTHACDVFVLPKRPSFTGKGTDATGYGWFVWREGLHNAATGRWQILDV